MPTKESFDLNISDALLQEVTMTVPAEMFQVVWVKESIPREFRIDIVIGDVPKDIEKYSRFRDL